MFAIRIDHVNMCLDAQLKPEISFSASEPSHRSFSNEEKYRNNLVVLILRVFSSYSFIYSELK